MRKSERIMLLLRGGGEWSALEVAAILGLWFGPYAELHRMEREGKIASRWLDMPYPRRRVYFAIPDKIKTTGYNMDGDGGPDPTQSDAEPVAWQTRHKGSTIWYTHTFAGKPAIDTKFYEARPLYTALTQSDPLPNEHQDSSKWVSKEAMERAHHHAQTNAEPVAWRVKGFGDDWIFFDSEEYAKQEAESAGNLIQPLYTAPPRPDASAGLIEAAEIVQAKKRNATIRLLPDAGRDGYITACGDIVDALRARAADKSTK